MNGELKINNECGYLHVEGFADFRLNGEESICQCRRHRRCEFDPWVGKIPWRRAIATHSSIFVWRIPWTEEPGGLQSIGRVRHD